MDPFQQAQLGRTGIRVTRLGFGSAPLGGLFTDVGEQTAVSAVRRAYELGVRYFDTAPLYGHGKSEGYYATAFEGVPRESFVLSTKVGRLLVPAQERGSSDIYVNLPPLDAVFDFSRDAVLRSLEESLKRLRMDRVDVLLIHDPDDHWEQAIGEAYPALADLRSQGVIGAIGAGMNQWEMLARFAQEGDFDCFLLAGRYTLLDHSGLPELFPLCQQKGISIVLGGPYNSGILASDLQPGATYFYREAPPEVLEQARRIKAVCDRHGVPLKAAALQFGLAHPVVASTIPGARSVAEVEENVEMAAFPVPQDLWDELKAERLIPEEAPIPQES